MRSAAMLIALAFGTLAGCTAEQVAQAGAEPSCLVLFRNYDQAVQIYGNTTNNRRAETVWRVPPAVSRTGQRLREGGCLTSDQDLAATYLLSDDVRGTRIVESGAPIEPIYLQAGIVEGITSEVQARQFFGGLGVRVRSQGAPGLGRRIFVGPFATEGGLAAATDLALQAGFVAPYPARF